MLGSSGDNICPCICIYAKGSQAKWCELMAVRAPTVKREWGQKTSTVHSHPQPRLRHSHKPTSPAIHDFLAGGKGDSRLWQGKAGAIHNLDPSIHNLVHEIWQGKARMAISVQRSPFSRYVFLFNFQPHPLLDSNKRPPASSTSPSTVANMRAMARHRRNQV